MTTIKIDSNRNDVEIKKLNLCDFFYKDSNLYMIVDISTNCYRVLNIETKTIKEWNSHVGVSPINSITITVNH